MKYEVILFDADETLYDFKKSERKAFKNTLLKFNIKYDENYHLKIYQEINTVLWKEFEQGLITQEKLKVERFKRLSDRLNVSFDETNFAKSYIEHLAEASFLYDYSIDLIENLNKSYKLAIVTNGLTFVQDRRIRKSIIAKYFETIVISEEILISKPNPKIFEYVLKNIKHTDKSKVLMVGDSLTSDIQGGINFGIDTCWYNPNKIVNGTSIKPTYEISNFSELKVLLLDPQRKS
ncbi:YjjG family noncanonical pyrimidine nucleotidase [Clostridium tagluense]|uniref:YjjG family noncanonical pyrimidine nucleotidase n=1 Tax=Clostridium tagluense TaxID=360422 RepID=UPI001C0DB54C|nr:YjjG family noncanonical pyrimidine nucleotidase [Clostridium tagluense]MBU3129084.1 YjjG family noncanonical pyrimidine nucleotidase [Clostridium tagluense]MCB2311304.1 YjjG family noncanonical pyrimidine nucleotidase [Clostridium tagluense]MCB2316054.1 YjjG family noncanonical pyrimidine nucleotidase [Clostridium tagluense]MCB2320880.1 YjjG family noncanonical pyrimidine nucleotidase [Clostridium tagluense]MCB2325923.1 YjjG family noncanonical pyrimidine nucleotidase [Clostridium tagluens